MGVVSYPKRLKLEYSGWKNERAWCRLAGPARGNNCQGQATLPGWMSMPEQLCLKLLKLPSGKRGHLGFDIIAPFPRRIEPDFHPISLNDARNATVASTGFEVFASQLTVNSGVKGKGGKIASRVDGPTAWMKREEREMLADERKSAKANRFEADSLTPSPPEPLPRVLPAEGAL